MSFIPDLILLSIALYFAWDLYRAYRAALGTTWQRIVGAVKGAAKSAWTGFAVASTTAISVLAQVADFVNAPSVASALTTYATPKVVAGIFIASAIIIELSRRRST